MEAAIGEALLSATLSAILHNMSSSSLLKFARHEQVLAEIKKWRGKLSKINAVLEDAEEKQSKSEAVKNWLRDLRDIAYDVEDVLDEFNTEAMRRKLTAGTQSSTSKVRAMIPCLSSSLSPRGVTFNVRMGSKLTEITARLQEIVKEKEELSLRENGIGKSWRTIERIPTTSLVDESRVCGREKDKEAIVELLLGDEGSSNEFSVIPIVGMGGLGKTTLAQLVYNDNRVKTYFELKAWVCVSEAFDISRITKTILQSVSVETGDVNDLNLLQENLKEKLSHKKFLIVLDDVWNENDDSWEVLSNPFRTGVPGCKLIVTTRNDGVASTTGASQMYRLQGLSDAACLSILEKHALGSRSFDEFPNLKEIGVKLVKKCKGLPLAMKTMGGLLRTKQNPDEWEAVLKSNIWDLPEKKNNTLPALELSYQHLPSPLKRCFAYCCLFPKDYEFDKNELVSLWMAEGFLDQQKDKKQIDDLGYEYFDELLSRSFFQRSMANETRFVMHDLINDLAKFVAEDIFLMVDGKTRSEKNKVSEKARYASFICSKYDVPANFEVFSNLKCLRTFLALRNDQPRFNYLSRNVLYELLPKFKRLRALSLSGYSITELPNLISDLKSMRHLNVSYTPIKRLPDSVCTLYNLQTLTLCHCGSLSKLPVGIKNLFDLHYLDISNTGNLQEMPPEIGTLTRLRLLPKFIVGKGDKLCIKELRELSRLQGRLSIYGLENIKDVQDVKVANLKEKHGLDELTLVWRDEFNDDSQNEQHELQVLQSLQPHRNIQQLKMVAYKGKDFPSWVGDPSFSNIVRITLLNCRNIRSLPSLGRLPSLKHLHIKGMDGVERVGPEFFEGDSFSVKSFPYLETLSFVNMFGWEEWLCCSSTVEDKAEGQFPRLYELAIQNCPKLKGKLPSRLFSLIKLEICNCPLLVNSLGRLPSLRELSLDGCNEVILRTAVEFGSLINLKLKRISGLSCFHEGLANLLVALEMLQIESCNEFKCLWKNGAEPERLLCLRSLIIGNCPQLVSLAGEVQGMYGLQSLKSLAVISCEALEKLPDWVMENQCPLEELRIEQCPLESFPRGKLPTTLKKLEIMGCKNLKSLPEGVMRDGNDNSNDRTRHLEVLSIQGCSSLTNIPSEKFPGTLQKLDIKNCMQLESLSETVLQNSTMLEEIRIGNYTNLKGLSLIGLTHLTRLVIHYCPALESFPERGLSIPNLKELIVCYCANLKSLPNQMYQLASLRHMEIESCPGILSLPGGGLAPNLTSLTVEGCQNLKQPMIEWGLNTLTSLTYFRIGGPCPAADVVSFPDDGFQILPTTLIHLVIVELQNLESISKGLQGLTSLERLEILLCPKLRSLPKEGLPASLGRLQIWGCPILEQRCLEEKGDYWPSIAHIPNIDI